MAGVYCASVDKRRDFETRATQQNVVISDRTIKTHKYTQSIRWFNSCWLEWKHTNTHTNMNVITILCRCRWSCRWVRTTWCLACRIEWRHWTPRACRPCPSHRRESSWPRTFALDWSLRLDWPWSLDTRRRRSASARGRDRTAETDIECSTRRDRRIGSLARLSPRSGRSWAPEPCCGWSSSPIYVSICLHNPFVIILYSISLLYIYYLQFICWYFTCLIAVTKMTNKSGIITASGSTGCSGIKTLK